MNQFNHNKEDVEKGYWSIVYDGWLLFAELVGRFNTKIIVSIIYFCLVSISWLFSSFCLKRQLLDRTFRVPEKSSWIQRDEEQNAKATLEKLKHQF